MRLLRFAVLSLMDASLDLLSINNYIKLIRYGSSSTGVKKYC
jgi:hypothetical protein